MFFPVAENGPELDRAVTAAKQVCAGCPVRAQCLAWALDALPYGVAGGMSAAERHRARRAAPARRTAAYRDTAGYEAPIDSGVPARGRGRTEVIAAGKTAIAHGVARDRVAAAFGVSRRTVDRWAADQHGTPIAAGAAAGAVAGGGR